VYVALKVLTRGEEVSYKAIISILISALTTGFTSATLSYDYDTDPLKRREAPEFYGYIPDEGMARTKLFVVMTFNSSLLLLLRSFSAALLMIADSRYFVWYMMSDAAVYLTQKAIRSDLHYWLPLEGRFELFISIGFRVCIKVIADFTGLVQFRGSGELGGIYWTLNMFNAFLFSFVAIWIYFSKERAAKEIEISTTLDSNFTGLADFKDVDELLITLDENSVWNMICLLNGAWLLTVVFFLVLMKREYLSTFVSRETGAEWARNYFLENTSDEVKSAILACNKKMWRSIEGEVKEWVMQNWFRWKENKPKWFTEAKIANIPDSFIPEDEDRGDSSLLKKARQRNSLFRGTLRASMPTLKVGSAENSHFARISEASAVTHMDESIDDGEYSRGEDSEWEDSDDDSEVESLQRRRDSIRVNRITGAFSSSTIYTEEDK
jgi:hypothetical protein